MGKQRDSNRFMNNCVWKWNKNKVNEVTITDENVQCEINLTYEKFGDVYKDGDSSIKLSG